MLYPFCIYHYTNSKLNISPEKSKKLMKHFPLSVTILYCIWMSMKLLVPCDLQWKWHRPCGWSFRSPTVDVWALTPCDWWSILQWNIYGIPVVLGWILERWPLWPLGKRLHGEGFRRGPSTPWVMRADFNWVQVHSRQAGRAFEVEANWDSSPSLPVASTDTFAFS